ncbi:unnamed protein product, partial [Durusdinium trenchii]
DLTLRLIAACVWSLQAALHILDHSTIILRDADAEAVHRHITRHLQCWQHLAHVCELRSLRLFRLRPKCHYLQHIAED